MRVLVVRRGIWQILAVCTARGDCPLLDFLADLDGKLSVDGRKMLGLFSRIAEQGPPRDTEVCHQVGPGIWELIVGQIRVLWMYDTGRVVLVSHGFVKKSRKTPQRELDLARANGARYRRARDQRLIETMEGVP